MYRALRDKAKNVPVRANLLLLVISPFLIAACATPTTGDLQLEQRDVVASAETQFKYVSGALKPQETYNYYVSTSSQHARISVLYAILEQKYGRKYLHDLVNRGPLEELSPIKIDSVSEVDTSYSRKADWASFVYTTVDVKLSNGETKRVKYKLTVSLAASVASDEPIVDLTSFEVVRVKGI